MGRGFFISAQIGRGGGRDAVPSHDLLFSSTLTRLPRKPEERRRRVGSDPTNGELPFDVNGGEGVLSANEMYLRGIHLSARMCDMLELSR